MRNKDILARKNALGIEIEQRRGMAEGRPNNGAHRNEHFKIALEPTIQSATRMSDWHKKKQKEKTILKIPSN